MSHAPPHEARPGQLVADCYRIETLIGRGAMGAVWSAVHVRLESSVAIKFLNPAIADNPEMLERFLREARSAAAVRSTHVVQIFDYGVDAGVPYIAMERLVGEPLDARLARGPLEPEQLDKIFGEIARAVNNAHELGVIHRDIKPANIFIAREGGHEVTKVLDFGIAKLVDHNLASPVGSGTNTGMLIGTPNYMSPEQARGQRGIDHRADLWSLAVLAFECLTGRQPFESNSIGDLVVQICTAQPLLPSDVASVPAGFDDWFLRGVNRDLEGRWGSADEMAEALHALLAAEGRAASSRQRSSAPRRIGATDTQVVAPPQRRPPESSLAALPDGATGTQASVATEVSRLPQTPVPGRRRWVLAAIVLLIGMGLIVAFYPVPTPAPPPYASSPTPTTESTPATAAGAAATPSLAAGIAEDPPIQKIDVPPVPEPVPVQNGEATEKTPPPEAAESEPSVRLAPGKPVRRKKPAQRERRPETASKPSPPPPPAPKVTPIDPFSDRL
jgi:serine/threonine protein kinase